MSERKFKITNAFKRDLKKHYLDLIVDKSWHDIINCLSTGSPLPVKYNDHALVGNFKDFRDCHVQPDLVLIYKISDDIVELHRLGSHSDLF